METSEQIRVKQDEIGQGKEAAKAWKCENMWGVCVCERERTACSLALWIRSICCQSDLSVGG